MKKNKNMRWGIKEKKKYSKRMCKRSRVSIVMKDVKRTECQKESDKEKKRRESTKKRRVKKK